MERTGKECGRTRRMFLSAGISGTAGLVLLTASAGRGAAGSILQPANPASDAFIVRAFEMRDMASASGDQAYGAIVVSSAGVIVGEAPSRVVVNGDPTAHAEMEAIRDAAQRLGSRDLSDHVLYSSSRPCPMCEAAAYWAGISSMVHGHAAASAGRPELCRG